MVRPPQPHLPTGVPGGSRQSRYQPTQPMGQLAFPELYRTFELLSERGTGMKIYSADQMEFSSSQNHPIAANWYTAGLAGRNLE